VIDYNAWQSPVRRRSPWPGIAGALIGVIFSAVVIVSAIRSESNHKKAKSILTRSAGLYDKGDYAGAAAEARTETAEVIARVSAPTVSAPTVEIAEPVEAASSTAWAPASSARIRLVEALVVAGVCGYFGFGLLSTVIGR